MRLLGIFLLFAAVAAAGPARELAKLEAARDASPKGYVDKYNEFKPRFEAFIQSHPGTDQALTAKLWLMQQAWWLYKDRPAMYREAARWADDILKNHADSPRLGDFALYHYVFSPEQKKKYFGWLLEHSKHASVQAAAHFGLARFLLRSAPEQSRAHLETLVKEYAEIAYRKSTFGAMARAYLGRHDRSKLQVGKPAPEIEGIDQSGKPMKLSQFRGKVVLLDFWGDW